MTVTVIIIQTYRGAAAVVPARVLPPPSSVLYSEISCPAALSATSSSESFWLDLIGIIMVGLLLTTESLYLLKVDVVWCVSV